MIAGSANTEYGKGLDVLWCCTYFKPYHCICARYPHSMVAYL